MRRFFHRKSNRWDGCRQILLVEKRQDSLKNYQRKHRNYQKKNTSYWFEGGKSVATQTAIRNYQSDTQNEASSGSDTTSQPHFMGYCMAQLRKLRKRELTAVFQEKFGCPPPKKTNVAAMIQQILNDS